MATTGISFQSTHSDQRVFSEVAGAFENTAACDSEARPKDQRVDGFSFKGGDRCGFTGRLRKRGSGQWFVDLQRTSGSRAAFDQLLAVLVEVLGVASALSNVRGEGPPSPLSDFSAGEAASPVAAGAFTFEGAGSDGGAMGVGDGDDEVVRLFEMADSEYVDVQREGVKALAQMSASAEGRSALAGAALVVKRVEATLASPDSVVKWNGSVLLLNMTQESGFCRLLLTVLGTLLQVMQLEPSVETSRAQLNVCKAIERTLAIPDSTSAFRKHTRTLEALSRSPNASVKNVAMLVLAASM